MTPDVSVVIAAWKAAACIETAIRSALASCDVTIEVIVVDDASPDETSAVVQRVGAEDSRVIALRLPENGGPSAARNLAISRASGRYLAVLDADDALEPDRLARLVALADASGADIVVDNMLEVSAEGEPLGPFLKSSDFASVRDIKLETWIQFNEPLKSGDCIGYLKPLIRRATLESMAVAYDPSLRNSEDYYLVATLLAGGARMMYVPEAGYRYTRAPGSISHRLKPEHTGAWLLAEHAFGQAFAGRLSEGERRALRRRERKLRNVHHMIAVTEALKARRIRALAGLMSSDLRASTYTLRTLLGVALDKVVRRSTVKSRSA